MVMKMKWIYIIVGVVLDLFDWFIVGLIPIWGDAVDALATLFWWKTLGVEGLVSALEFIPGFDIFPTNIVLGLIAARRGDKK